MRNLTRNYYSRIQIAAITAVDPQRGVVSISFIDQWGERSDVPLPVLSMSRNSWFRAMPDVNDLVMVGLRSDDSAVILGWYPANYAQRVQAFDANQDNAVGGDGKEMMQAIRPGEYDLRSKGGAYFRANNIGDWLFATPTSRTQMFGLQGLTHNVQNAWKATDGKSWLRFGVPYRFFPLLSDREMPVSGDGLPTSSPSSLREHSVILYDADGNVAVQEAIGDVVDESGITGLSGYTATGVAQTHVGLGTIGKAASTFSSASLSDIGNALNKTATSVVDSVKDFANGVVTAVKGRVAAIKGAATKIGNSIVDGKITGIIDGLSDASGAIDGITGVGAVGKRLKYRLQINQKGKPQATVEIDEDGNITHSTQGTSGYTVNANKGSLSFYGLTGIKLVGRAVTFCVNSITETVLSSKATYAGTDITRDAGGQILDSGATVGRSASGTIHDYAVTSILIESDGSVTVKGADVNVNGTGTVVVSAPAVSVTADVEATVVAPLATITTGGTILSMTPAGTILTTPNFNVIGTLQVNGVTVTVP